MGAACPDPFSIRSNKVKKWEQCQELGLLGPAVRFYLLSLFMGPRGAGGVVRTFSGEQLVNSKAGLQNAAKVPNSGNSL